MDKTTFEDLRGKVCVITGGTGVIGNAIARATAAHEVKTVVVSRILDKAEQAARQIQRETGTPCLGASADVLDAGQLQALRDVVKAKLGPVDVLINCAGGNRPSATTAESFITKQALPKPGGAFDGLSLAGFSEVLDLNLLGTVLPTQVFAADMVARGKGVILNISSMSSVRPLTRIPAYGAAKAAVNNLTQWLAVHYAKAGIRVNAVAPGFLLTEQNRFLLVDKNSGKLTERGQSIIGHTPMGELGNADDIPGAALFLMSDMARFITGIVLPVDGGFSAYSGV